MISITVNGVEYPLPVQTAELQTLLDSMYDAGRLSELVNPYALLSGALDSDWPHPPATEWPRPRLGALYWPVVGLAHYAFGCFLIDEYTLGQIRSGMATAGTNTIVVKFTDDPTDGAETARSVTMHFLATRPIVRTTSAALTTNDNGTDPVDAWVLLLVDDRYRLLHTSVTDLAVTSWADVFASGDVVVADAVDATYLVPGERWTADKASGRSLAWLMDIAALSVGSRIVNVPGESPSLQRPTADRQTALADAHTAAATRFYGGGPVVSADVVPGLPNSIRVIFCAPSETTPAKVDVAVQSAYDWPSTSYLTHWADASASTSTRATIANQSASDWYEWQFVCYDTLYSGIVAVPASGYCWAVEWYHDATTACTRFIRPPHWYGYLLNPQDGVDLAPLLSWKGVVRWATTDVLPSNTYDSTAGTITGSASGALTAQDDVSPAANDRALIKDEGAANGIYVVTRAGDSTHPFLLTRAADAPITALSGAAVTVQEGTQNKETMWQCSYSVTPAVPTTWTLIPSAAFGEPGGNDTYLPLWTGGYGNKLGTAPVQATYTNSVGPSGSTTSVISFYPRISDGTPYATPGVQMFLDMGNDTTPDFSSITVGLGGSFCTMYPDGLGFGPSTVGGAELTNPTDLYGGGTRSALAFGGSGIRTIRVHGGTTAQFEVQIGATIYAGITSVTLGPGFKVIGGIVYDPGSGTFGTVTSVTGGSGLSGSVTTSGSLTLDTTHANTWTAPQTVHSGASTPAFEAQQTSSDSSNTIQVKNIAGTVTYGVTGAGDVTATSFSGAGAGLTALNASSLASGTVPFARTPPDLFSLMAAYS